MAFLGLFFFPGQIFAGPAGSIEYDSAERRVIITGTPEDDTVEIAPADGSWIRVSMTSSGATVSRLFDATFVSKIVCGGDLGNDTVVNRTAIPLDAVGGDGDDVLVAGDGDSFLIGGAGNDRLAAGNGNDILLGESGNDTLSGGGGNDLIDGGIDRDILNGGEGNDVLQGDSGDDIVIGDAGDDILIGGDDNDALLAGEGADALRGGNGNDELDGGTGEDVLDGDDGDDVLKGGDGRDLLRGGAGDDTLSGDKDDDILQGETGDDILAGQEGDDRLHGEDGNDSLDGGQDADYLYGGPGRETLYGGEGYDVIFGGDGDDYLIGGLGRDELFGEGDNDILKGESVDFVLDGGSGDNTVTATERQSPVALGVVFNPANDPDCNDEDILRAFSTALPAVDQISIFYSFRQQEYLPSRLQLLSQVAGTGLKSLVQMQVQFLGEPNPPVGMQRSFGDEDVRALFLDNVRQFAELKPDFMNLSPEVNFLYYFNMPEFALYASLYQEAYQLIKQISPETRVGVSYHYLIFRGFEQVEAVTMLSPHDFLAFTTYPIWMLDKGYIDSPADIQPEYYTWIRNKYPDENIMFSEIGWPSSGKSTPEMQAEFVRRIPALMADTHPMSVNWTLLNDVQFFHTGLLSDGIRIFLEEHDVDPILLFDRLNHMGLHSLEGIPRNSWFEFLKLEFQ